MSVTSWYRGGFDTCHRMLHCLSNGWETFNYQVFKNVWKKTCCTKRVIQVIKELFYVIIMMGSADLELSPKNHFTFPDSSYFFAHPSFKMRIIWKSPYKIFKQVSHWSQVEKVICKQWLLFRLPALIVSSRITHTDFLVWTCQTSSIITPIS